MAFQVRSGRRKSTGAGAKLGGVWERTRTSKPAAPPHPPAGRSGVCAQSVHNPSAGEGPARDGW